jgi:HK97 family phage portal protein
VNNEFICTPGAGGAYEMQAAGFSDGADYWYEAFPSMRNDTGVKVNAYTALGNCHVWKALNVLAGDMGQLPVKLFKKVGGKSVEVEGIPEIECLRDEPNPWMLPSVWKETAMWVAALRGNSLNWVFRPTPQTIRLVPLRQDRVNVEIADELTGDFFYTYRTETGAVIPFNREDIMHIPGLSVNGIWGMDLIDVAKNVIGGGLAIEKHVNRSFANGARPGGVLKHPNRMTPEGAGNLRREWEQLHQGADNAGRVAVLQEGMEYQAIALTMEASQVEELRRLDREFVASLFNLPLFKLNSLEHSATRSNLEQQQQEYLYGSLMRWLNRFAEEFRRKILSPTQRKQGMYYRWITEAILRGDTATRFAAYGVAIQNRIMNPNEAREKEDMPPYPGGEEFGNPNIDPKAANDVDNKGGRPPGSRSADALIDRKLRDIVATECNYVRDASQNAVNFVEWIEDYYSNGFHNLTGKALAPYVEDVKGCVIGYVFDPQNWAVTWKARAVR